jgi:pimeloyl-ACP methyl ester carboxylesterase
MYKARYIFILIILFVGLASFAVGSAYAQLMHSESSDAFEPAECWFDSPIPLLPGPEFECGYINVPEQHALPDGPTIRLPVAILRTQSDDPRPDPLFMAQGGPGGDAFEVFPIIIGSRADMLGRDFVIFNQRGTQYAEPNLMCTESFEAAAEILALTGEEADARSLEALSECYDRLNGEGINLSAYNSLENAADVDAIREALGYEQYNFYGVSYGTLLGLHLLRNHPDHLRSVILDGVVPPNINFIPQVSTNTDRVFTEIIQTCENDRACRSEYPNLEERFFNVVDELNQTPKKLTIKDSKTGKRVTTLLDGDTLVDVLFQAFYLPDSYAIFPKLVANLEAGDYTFVRGIWPLFAFDRSISEGMYFSIICAEDADFAPSDAVLEGVRPYFAAGAAGELQTYLDACKIWQVDQLPPEIDEAVNSDVPTLLLSGHYDPITPPLFAAVAAGSLQNGYSYVNPTGSHGVAFNDSCMDDIIRQFVELPEKEPDAACLAEIVPAEFIQSNALSLPFLAEVSQFTQSMWIQLGVASLFLIGILSAFFVLPLAWLIGKLRKKDSLKRAYDSSARRLKWVGGILSLVFGTVALVFVSGTLFFTMQSLFNGMVNIFSVSGAAAPFFVLPLILAIIAVILLVIAIKAWRQGIWSAWAKIYYSFLAICALGYVAVLVVGGMMTVLL